MKALLLISLTAHLLAVTFVDATAAAGLKFTHNAGKVGKKWMPETMGAGCAWFDFDNDGWPDIFLVNGKDWAPRGRRTPPALYRNNRNGTFTNVTVGSGLDVEMYGLGVSSADYDGDGRLDLYVTALEGDRLFHNEGHGKFRDVTAASGIANASFGTSSAWFDFDRDGRLDLFVANYVSWKREKDLWCSMDGATKSYCTPESYPGTSSKLFRNLGGGKFADVTVKAGVGETRSKSLGVAVLDYNGDGWPDLFVSNDTQPNKLYRNDKNGHFTEEGVAAGVAFGEDGVARGAMGVDAADYDRSGRPHLAVGNFSNQMLGLYHNEGKSLFVDESPRSNLGRSTLLTLTFGLFYFDYDLDGWLDLFLANGHIDEEINRVQRKVQYAQIPLLFRNLGQGRFENTNAFTQALVARGAAYADFDHDGDLDILVTSNGGAAKLYRNDGGNANNWLSVRAPIGTLVTVGKQSQSVSSGGSYCSQSDLARVFGLGKEATVTVDIQWPNGKRKSLTAVKANQFLVLPQE